MAFFGIPGAEPASASGEFLGRLQYDARVGFWQVVKRVQDADGNWEDEKSEPFRNPQYLLDLGSLEIGYIHFGSPPSFLLVPYGQQIPPQPQDMSAGMNPGDRPRKAFLPGFRVKVMSQKTFGDALPYFFASNSKNVLEPMDELWKLFEVSPEARQGLLPLISVTGNRPAEVKTPRGTNTFYGPVFEITHWYPRPAAFGERTVPVPGQPVAKDLTFPATPSGLKQGAQAPAAPVVLAPAPQIPLSRMSNGQTGTMARASVPLSNTTMRSNFPKASSPLPADMRGGSTGNIIDDEIPFSPCR